MLRRFAKFRIGAVHICGIPFPQRTVIDTCHIAASVDESRSVARQAPEREVRRVQLRHRAVGGDDAQGTVRDARLVQQLCARRVRQARTTARPRRRAGPDQEADGRYVHCPPHRASDSRPAAAWNEDPSARPSFDQIINYLDEAMIECALDGDADAQGLWSNNFKGKEYVPRVLRVAV